MTEKIKEKALQLYQKRLEIKVHPKKVGAPQNNKNAKGLFTTVVETTLVKSMFSLNPLKF